MKKTRKVNQLRRGVLPTSSYLWLLTVCHSGQSFERKQQQLPKHQEK